MAHPTPRLTSTQQQSGAYAPPNFETGMPSFFALSARLSRVIPDKDLAHDAEGHAWLSALAARIAYRMEDDARGQRLETSAYTVNNNHSPPKVRPAYTPRPIPGRQAAATVDRILEYDQRGAIIAEFDEAVAELVPEASAGRYEEALANLGTFLGFEAERLEKTYGVGPDVLWRPDGAFDFVIEAKSEKEEGNPLYKKDHAQLLEAEHWFKEPDPGRAALRVSALPEAVADAKATPVGSFALRLDEITKIVGALRGVLIELVSTPGKPDVLRDSCEAALMKVHVEPFGEKAKAP